MSLINKILSILKEEDNLFKPRKVNDRLNKIKDPIERKVLQYNIGDIIDVYVFSLEKNLKAKLISDPEKDNKDWIVLAEIYIEKEDIEKGQLYGVYENFLYFPEKFEKWVMYGKFTQHKYNPGWTKVNIK